MTKQHTPGPWAIQTCNENGPFLDSFYLSAQVKTWDGNNDERIVCRFPTGTGQFSNTGRENLANARLIAAAPELLAILKRWAIRIDDSCEDSFAIDRIMTVAEAREINAAIAKAEGRAE